MFKQATQGENQNQSYMQLLDNWIDKQIIEPLFEAWEMEEKVADEESAKLAAQDVEETVKEVHKAIREKVLDSYRNGQKAKSSKPTQGSAARRRYAAR